MSLSPLLIPAEKAREGIVTSATTTWGTRINADIYPGYTVYHPGYNQGYKGLNVREIKGIIPDIIRGIRD